MEPALRAAVKRLPAALSRISAYHFGWHNAAGTALTDPSSGKAVRPALAYLAAEALGGPPRCATPGAVAIELVHNFALVHDDIMDGDIMRRNRPTLWKQFGTGPALLAGDGLHILAIDTLLSQHTDRARTAVSLLTRAMIATLHGQAKDLGFTQRPWSGPAAVTPDEYRQAAAAKTGALIACSTAVGAVLAGGHPRHVARFAAFGRHLGIAFQCTDDVIGLWGEPGRTGKPVGGDLLAARKTLPIIAALASDTPAARGLLDLLSRGGEPLTANDLPEALHLVDVAGGRAAAEAEAQRHMTAAIHALAPLRISSQAREELNAMALYLTRRDR
ncbi:polyprenyl synthetase family protein [Streptomyces enissocaesilis]|uniref:Family 2 encapsulin nanocompartment cargo protein polyprenyl transferase n=1 Tax=Streptomyces enissocaesilis TaxID=332589 RepID=A0ABP6J4M4_9ACTN